VSSLHESVCDGVIPADTAPADTGSADTDNDGPAQPVDSSVYCSKHDKSTRITSVAAGLTYLACGCHIGPDDPRSA